MIIALEVRITTDLFVVVAGNDHHRVPSLDATTTSGMSHS